MGLFSRFLSSVNNDTHQISKNDNNQIKIIKRNDGLATTGLPSFINPQIASFSTSLQCGDGTKLNITTASSLVTGVSSYSGEILIKQIASALKSGYAPLVISSSGKTGKIYQALRLVYPESLLHYISDSNDSGSYNPFGLIPHSRISDFFYRIITTSQQYPTNNMLIRNYINVCVRVFFSSNSAIKSLIIGQINHMSLIQEINHLFEQHIITDTERIQLTSLADSSRDVSVTVLSTFQDYVYKMQRANAVKPSIRVRQTNTPKITILSGNSQNVQTINDTINNAQTYSAINLAMKECIFINVDNNVMGISPNAPYGQCFQWYLSQTLQTEFDSIDELRQTRILLIVENLSSLQLKWFYWLLAMPNCIVLLDYDDFYSLLADAPDLREQLVGRMDRIFFFSMMNSQSAEWASHFFGNHFVPKDVVTDQPARTFVDLLFTPKSIAHDKEEKPWYNSYEIQHLGDSGIVYCRRDKIFKPLYCENGNLYEDKYYRGQFINFCKFGFK